MAERPFPTGIRTWSSSLGPAGSLGALYAPLEGGKPNHSHGDLRTVDDPTIEHRAGVRWDGSVRLRSVRVRFAGRWIPRVAELWIEGEEPRCVAALTERDQEVEIDADAAGVFVRQAPGGGSAVHPGSLRIERLTPVPAATAPLRLTLHRVDGGPEVPGFPAAQDGDARTVLELSDATALDVEGEAFAGLRLRIPRVGTSGSPAWLRRWLRLDDLTSGVPCRRFLDAGEAGIVGGASTVWLVPESPRTRVRLAFPTAQPFVLGLIDVRPGAPDGEVEEVASAPGVGPVPRRRRLPDPAGSASTLDAAEALFPPLAHAASLGVPGADDRLGVAPDGGLLVRRTADRFACVAVGVDGERPGDAGPWTARWVVPARVLSRTHRVAGVHLEQRLALAADGVDVTLRLRTGRTRGERVVTVAVAVGEFEWLTSLPPGPDVVASADPDGWSVEDGPYERRLTRAVHLFGGEDSVVRFRIPLPATRSPDVAFERVLGEAVPALLPHPRWDALLPALLAQAATFVRGGDRVRYGVYPSLYDPDVFGLEEEYLLHGLALWGCTDAALRSFRATYLQADHLDHAHYLHDLRNGLTPWQTERLLSLAGLGWSDLSDRERALLDGTAAWLRARRVQAASEGVLEGLLPPYRYGGDVDFPTQSLTIDAVAAAGLRALADLRGDTATADEATAYKARILEVLDDLHDGERQVLHTGPEDPGDYLQLLAAGILAPLDFFDPDDVRLPRLLEQLRREGRTAMGLPRFDGWGGGESVDAVYCLGIALHALRSGDVEAFHTTLLGLAGAAMDRTLHTFREVGPLPRPEPDPTPRCWLPGRRLDRSEPCLGSLGVLLQLLRGAVVTELPDPDGRAGTRLLVLGGVPATWWDEGDLRLEGAPTRAGRVTVTASRRADGLRVTVEAPGARAIVVRGPDGRRHELPGGTHEVTL